MKTKRSATTSRLLAGVACTSTPRKSKVHFDQRRLLDQLMRSSPSPSPLTVHKNKYVKMENNISPDISVKKTPQMSSGKHKDEKTLSKRLQAIAGGLKRIRRNSSIFGRRLSKRMQEICTPSTGETTSSALSTPAVTNDKTLRKQVVTLASVDKTNKVTSTTLTTTPNVAKNKVKTEHIVVSSSVTTSGGKNMTPLLQRRVRKRTKREKGIRPSLCLKGNIFAKYRTPNKVIEHDLMRYKSRKHRREQNDKIRLLKSLEAESPKDEGEGEKIEKTLNCRVVKRNGFEMKNICAADSVIIAKSPANNQKLVEDTFTFGEEQFEQSSFKKELVTSQDLENFDRLIENIKYENQQNDYSTQGNLYNFEKLVQETESIAPFEVKDFDASKSSHSNTSFNSHHSSLLYNHSQQSSYPRLFSHIGNDSSSVANAATSHLSPSNQTSHLSRTIYGSTVIYNHRIPHINTTSVRKSSIYVKNRKTLSQPNLESSSCNDVVLITNQTITFIDIMRMWSQMDNTTRTIISFAILASFTTIFSLFISFYSRR